MVLVEGPTLADRLAVGTLPVDETLEVLHKEHAWKQIPAAQ